VFERSRRTWQVRTRWIEPEGSEQAPLVQKYRRPRETASSYARRTPSLWQETLRIWSIDTRHRFPQGRA